METTIAEARKLLKKLKKKFPNQDCSVDIVFNSWGEEHLTAYVSGPKYSSIKHYNSINEIKKYYNL